VSVEQRRERAVGEESVTLIGADESFFMDLERLTTRDLDQAAEQLAGLAAHESTPDRLVIFYGDLVRWVTAVAVERDRAAAALSG
jgi:hypothetical protein